MKNGEEAFKEIQTILNKYNLLVDYQVTFPIYRILPDEVKLALKVLEKHGMKILFVLKEKPTSPEH
jgi:hypothetical protein